MSRIGSGFGGRGGFGTQQEIGNLVDIFKRLQGAQTLGPLQKAAVDVQKSTRTNLEKAFAEQGEVFTKDVAGGFEAREAEQSQNLAARGVSPETLALLGDFGSDREKKLALGQLQDALIGGRLDLQTGISKNIANIFTGATETGTGLLSQLLSGISGLGGRRSFSAGGSGKLTSADINADLSRRLGPNTIGFSGGGGGRK